MLKSVSDPFRYITTITVSQEQYITKYVLKNQNREI